MQFASSLMWLRRLVIVGSVVACAAASAVGASASRNIAAPDVFERYAAVHSPNPATAPDMLERYVTAHSLGLTTVVPAVGTDRIVDDSFRDPTSVATPIGAPDVVERYAATHDPNSATAPDVLERYLTTHSIGLTTVVPAVGTDRIVDDSFRDPKAVVTPIVTPAGDRIVDDSFRDAARYVPSRSSSQSGVDWEDFGIGAGAMFGLTLLVAGLGLGAVAMRHRGGRLETS